MYEPRNASSVRGLLSLAFLRRKMTPSVQEIQGLVDESAALSTRGMSWTVVKAEKGLRAALRVSFSRVVAFVPSPGHCLSCYVSVGALPQHIVTVNSIM